MKFIQFILPIALTLAFLGSAQAQKRLAYIHGNVSDSGELNVSDPYHQMLLDDTGSRGLSILRDTLVADGFTISQHYDQETVLNATFLSDYDGIIFGLHQKVWSTPEQDALDQWIRNGGGIFMYSDSAAGGRFNVVGIRNPVGQNAVNSILSRYGMEVAVDQGGGTRQYTPDAGSENPIIFDQPTLEGEGVSPVAVDPNASAEVLIPLDTEHETTGRDLNINPTGVTISNPIWATMAYAQAGRGRVVAMFDRQPLWNNGEGSDITEADNEEILLRTVRFMTEGTPPKWEPTGWNYMTWPYVYSFGDSNWRYFSDAGTRWQFDFNGGGWNRLPVTSGWLYWQWPYFYQWETASWHYFSVNNSQWVNNLTGDGQWYLMGPLPIVAD